MTIPLSELGSGSDVPSFSFSKPEDKIVGTITFAQDPWKQVKNDDGTTRNTLLLTFTIDPDKCVSHRKVKNPDGTTTLEAVDVTSSPEWNVWVPESSRMLSALREAIANSGATGIDKGAQVMFKLTGYGEPKKVGWSAPKLFTAAYKAPAVKLPEPADDEEPF
jgi:hypothetical protein